MDAVLYVRAFREFEDEAAFRAAEIIPEGRSDAGLRDFRLAEIDVAASDEDTMLLAECKYRNELTDADLIDELLDKSESVNPKNLSKRYALFSKSGYTEVAKIRAQADGIELIELKDMFRFLRRLSGPEVSQSNRWIDMPVIPIRWTIRYRPNPPGNEGSVSEK